MLPINQCQPIGSFVWQPSQLYIPVPFDCVTKQAQSQQNVDPIQALRNQLHEAIQVNWMKQSEIAILKVELLKYGNAIDILKSKNSMYEEVKEKFLKFIENERDTVKKILLKKDMNIGQLTQKLADKEKELTQNRVDFQQKIDVLEKDLAAKKMVSSKVLDSNSTNLEVEEEGHTKCKEMAKKHALMMSCHVNQMFDQSYKKNSALLENFQKDLKTLTPSSRRYQASILAVQSIKKNLKLIEESRKEFQFLQSAMDDIVENVVEGSILVTDKKRKLPTSASLVLEKKTETESVANASVSAANE